MKKMIAMGAIAACASVFALESANIVGYAQNGLKNGATMVSAQFISVGNDTISLDSFIPVGENLDGSIEIQTLDSAGYTKDSYVWIDWGEDMRGWMVDFVPVTGVTFEKGQGLWIFGSVDKTDDNVGQAIQTAGQVCLDDIVVELRNGGSGIGNPYPVSIALQDILPEGENLDGNIEIQTLDSAGYTKDSYVWIDWGEDMRGWMVDFVPVDNVTIEPGQGLWVFGSVDKTKENVGQYLRFPAPEL